jgi:hypothetical protein
VYPSASWDVNDARERARRALLAANAPTPRRGAVPEDAVPGAEACVYLLRLRFSLLTSGSGTAPARAEIEHSLRSLGLTEVVLEPGPVFAASTGAACIHGTFTEDDPSFTISPLAVDGSCPT